MLQFESTITALNPAHPTTLSEILTADSWSANNHSALLFFQIVYIVSLSNTDRQISGNATTASVHPVTVDESDSGPTAANYDAYQHLHTHTHAHEHTLTARKAHTMSTWCSTGMQSESESCTRLYYNIHKCKPCCREMIDWYISSLRTLSFLFPWLDYVILVAEYFLGLFVCLCKVFWNVCDKGVSWKNSFQTDSQE